MSKSNGIYLRERSFKQKSLDEMLIPLSDLVARHNFKVFGILHVGAHKCEELADYLKLGVPLERVIWVEANADLCSQAQQKIPGVQIHNLTVTDTDGKACDF